MDIILEITEEKLRLRFPESKFTTDTGIVIDEYELPLSEQEYKLLLEHLERLLYELLDAKQAELENTIRSIANMFIEDVLNSKDEIVKNVLETCSDINDIDHDTIGKMLDEIRENKELREELIKYTTDELFGHFVG